ncbi:mechanosensitive ion channel (plasmid) [Edwardsiella tarda]|uniref:mechanosensitive ion channel family protein n=1 Tax=Edwardsiella tarda TaxID=636 RepID=UPI0024445C45|nr:mechanosensitive ion channel domain-containing protein [Edwardsiella tarda]WGE30840.1 mechanosensitive ion channel [Edwardsiella tarda]
METILHISSPIVIMIGCVFLVIITYALHLYIKREHSIPSILLARGLQLIIIIIALDVMILLFERIDYLNIIIDNHMIATIKYALISYFILKIVFGLSQVFSHHQENKGVSKETTEVIRKVINIVSTFFVILFVFEQTGFNMSGILTFGGVGGIAIGIASKDILSNFLSGMILYFDRPFNKGDWILLPEKKVEGIVDSIGWRTTKIVTFDKSPLYIPNSVFSSIMIENPGRVSARHVVVNVTLNTFDLDAVDKIMHNVTERIDKLPNINRELENDVYIKQVTKDGINITISLYTKTQDQSEYLNLKQTINQFVIIEAQTQNIFTAV